MKSIRSAKFWIMALSVFFVAGQARADLVDRELDRLFHVTRMDDTQNRTIDALVEMQMKQNPSLRKIEREYTEFVKQNLSWKALEPDVRKSYRQIFSVEELSQMADFYEKPAGQKALRELPRLMAEGARLGQQKIQKGLPKFMESVKHKLGK